MRSALARLAVHVMRRSAYTGRRHSGPAGRVGDVVAEPCVASCCAASTPRAPPPPGELVEQGDGGQAGVVEASLRMPFRITLMRRPSAYASSRANCLSRPPHTITRLPRWSRIGPRALGQRLDVRRSTDQHWVASLGRDQRGGAISSWPARWSCPPPPPPSSRAASCEANPSIFTLRPLAGQDHAVLLEVGGEAHRFLRGRAGITAFAPLRGGDDRGGGRRTSMTTTPRPARSPPRRGRREVDVDLHAEWAAGGVGSRSRNFVSTLPAMKSDGA